MGIGRMIGRVEFLFGKLPFLEEILRQLQFVGQQDRFFIVVDPLFLGSQGPDVGFGRFGVVPEVRGEGFFLLVGDFDAFGIYVKDTSSALQGALQYL